MNERQAYALAHPLNGSDQDISLYRRVRQRGDGSLLVVILAVDR